jgi:hypothetical protein
VQVGADGIGQQQDWLAGGAIKAIGDARAVAGGDEGEVVAGGHVALLGKTVETIGMSSS